MQDLLQSHGRNELNQTICAGRCKYPVHKPHSLDVVVMTSLTPSHHCDIVMLLYAHRMSIKQTHKDMQQLRSVECCNRHYKRMLTGR